jgi:ubiquinone/menaquinone biosynthesis C-methylase UbiE
MSESRLQREAEFHDKTFADDGRAAAGKFYLSANRAKECYRELIGVECSGKKILEYGCGKGSYAFGLARLGAEVTGIDISPEGIEIAKAQAVTEGLENRLSFAVMNAEELQFEDAYFDVVCGSGILHHLDLDKALTELARVLKPSGSAVFFEPLGHNVLINLYRRLTPKMRSQDEHPLLMCDLKRFSTHFKQCRFHYYNLLALAAVPFHSLPGFKGLLAFLHGLDRLLLSAPFLKSQAWLVVVKLEQPS